MVRSPPPWSPEADASDCTTTSRDFVEELEAERSHQKANGPVDPLDKFCEESPEADECRTYEN